MIEKQPINRLNAVFFLIMGNNIQLWEEDGKPISQSRGHVITRFFANMGKWEDMYTPSS